MAYTINAAWVETFADNYHMLAQQQGSRLERACRIAYHRSETHNFERLGATAAVDKTSRHADTPEAEMPHTRRKVVHSPYHWAEMLDRGIDLAKMLTDPESDYVKAGTWAMGRKKDARIYAASRGNATDGASSPVALPAGQKIANGATDLTLDKLLETQEIIDSKDPDDNDPRFFVFDAKARRSLLNTTEITSSDYNSVKALVNGQINTFLGFTFIRYEALASGTGEKFCMAWCQSAMGWSQNLELIKDVGPRRDKSVSMQVYLEESGEATRIEDELVVEIAVARP